MWASVFGGYGFGREALELAFFEGGIAGMIFAVPNGLFTYYAVMRRRITAGEFATIFLASLFGGCLLATIALTVSAFLTPVVTITFAIFIRQRHAAHRQAVTG